MCQRSPTRYRVYLPRELVQCECACNASGSSQQRVTERWCTETEGIGDFFRYTCAEGGGSAGDCGCPTIVGTQHVQATRHERDRNSCSHMKFGVSGMPVAGARGRMSPGRREREKRKNACFCHVSYSVRASSRV